MATDTTETEFRTCKRCELHLPLSSFDIQPRRPSAPYPPGPPARIFTCHTCVTAARTAGIKRAAAERRAMKQQEVYVSVTRKNGVATTASRRETFGHVLQELTALADYIEHPPHYRELLSAAQQILAESVLAAGVWVVGDSTMTVLREVVTQAEEDFNAR
jgi:hypothetical protein